jgi:predicted ATP-dependent endonuclease of OLD family
MQTHLKGFGLENFRVFKDYTWFDFAPITILTGPNSSGKSSLIKALLMLKDNFERGTLPPTFEITGEGYNDGRVIEGFGQDGLIYSETRREEPTYHEAFEYNSIVFNSSIHGLNSSSRALSRNGEGKKLSFVIEYGENNTSLYYQLTFKIENKTDEAKNISLLQIYDSCKSNRKPLLFLTPDSIYFDIDLYNELVSDSNKIIKISENIEKQVSSEQTIPIDIWFKKNNFGELSKEYSNRLLKALGIRKNSNGSYSCEFMEERLSKLDFWASNRNEQRKSYTESDALNFKRLLEELHSLQKKEEIKDILGGYTSLFGIQGSLNSLYEPEKDSYFPNIDNLSLSNFGYGYTQLIYLFLKIAIHGERNYIRTNFGSSELLSRSTLMLEEPEANLHPNLQSRLADLFVGTSQLDNIQYIIETHSEYLIRKLQYLVLKGKIQPKDVVIYYFKDPNSTDDEPLVKKINIQKNGRLTGAFGKGFLDETGRLMASLLTGEYLN